jgi:hypothetical protein
MIFFYEYKQRITLPFWQTNLQGAGKSSSPNALGIFACNVYFINLARKEKMFKGYTYYENFFGKRYKLIYTTTVN